MNTDNKPSDIERWAWNRAEDVAGAISEDWPLGYYDDWLGLVARALMEAREGNITSDNEGRKKDSRVNKQEQGVKEAIVQEANLRNSYASVRLKMALVHLAAADKTLSGED